MTKYVTTAKLTNGAIFYRVGVPNSHKDFGFRVATNYKAEKRANMLRDTSQLPTFVNLGVLLPPIADQGDLGDCQSFTMDYNIGSYYVMLQYYSLTFSNNLLNYFLNNIWKQGETTISYYLSAGNTNPNSIINPLYNWYEINGCSSKPSLVPNQLNYFPTSQAGVYSYQDYNLSFDPPVVSNDLIVGCPVSIQPNSVELYPFLPVSSTPSSAGYLNGTLPLFQVNNYQTYINQNGGTASTATTVLLNTIQTYLNQGTPLFLGINLNNFFLTNFQFYSNPSLPTYYNSSNIVPVISTTSTPNAPIIFNGINGIWYGTNNTSTEYTEVKGGHAITLCGYINNVQVNNNGSNVPLSSICPDNSTGVFIFKNQWGPTFGNNGYGYISYNYFFNCFNSTEFNVVTNPITNTSMNGSPLDGLYYLPFNTEATDTYKQMVRSTHNKTN
jgi:hypothetical protein